MSNLHLNTETMLFIFAAAGAMNQKLYQMIEFQSKQIHILKSLLGKQPRLNTNHKRALSRMAKDIERRILELGEHIVTIDTLRRWYRELIASTYTAKKRGRPRLSKEIENLVVSIAQTNCTWGEETIADRIAELGYSISPRTVANILKRNGIPPAPERSQTNNWSAFIEANFNQVIAIDCATWEVPDPWGKRTIRHHALYALRLGTREVKFLGVTDHADGAWATQCIRSLTNDCEESFLHCITHVVMDNDPIFIQPMKECFQSIGITVNLTTKGQPWMNGYIERFIGTTRRDLSPWFIPFSTASLRAALQAHTAYYNNARTHQSTDHHRPPKPTHDRFSSQDGIITMRSHLGNNLNSYYREAG